MMALFSPDGPVECQASVVFQTRLMRSSTCNHSLLPGALIRNMGCVPGTAAAVQQQQCSVRPDPLIKNMGYDSHQ